MDQRRTTENTRRTWLLLLGVIAALVVVVWLTHTGERPAEQVPPGTLPDATEAPDEDEIEAPDGPLERPPGTAPADPRRPATVPYQGTSGGGQDSSDDGDEQSRNTASERGDRGGSTTQYEPSVGDRDVEDGEQEQSDRDRRLDELAERVQERRAQREDSVHSEESADGEESDEEIIEESEHIPEELREAEPESGDDEEPWEYETDEEIADYHQATDEFDDGSRRTPMAGAERDEGHGGQESVTQTKEEGRSDVDEGGVEPQVGIPETGVAVPRGNRAEPSSSWTSGDGSLDEAPATEGEQPVSQEAFEGYRDQLDEAGPPQPRDAALYAALATTELADALYLLSADRLLSEAEASRQRDDLVELLDGDPDGASGDDGDGQGSTGGEEVSEQERESPDEMDDEWTVWVDAADWLRYIQEVDYPALDDLVEEVEEAAAAIDPEVSEEEQIDELIAFYEAVEIVLEAMAIEDGYRPDTGS